MCGGGGGDQTVTQKTELDPAMRRLLYGGTIADPRGGFGGGSSAVDAVAASERLGGGSDNDGSNWNPISPMRTSAGSISNAPSDFEGGSSLDSNVNTGDIGVGGLYANGGAVMPQQGIASLNQGQMPMMGGQMPNLSDPMTAATLAMAVRRPEMQYGSIMSNPVANQSFGYAEGGYVEGPGTGRSDDIEAQIYQNGVPVQEARLSDGEFVMTERAVKGAGNGDREAGAAKMYRMMQQFERGGRV